MACKSIGEPMDLLKFFPLVKVDERNHTITGVATAEVPDQDGEIAEYEGCKAAYKLWADEASKSTLAAGQDISYGNIRLQHGIEIGGKVVTFPIFDDATKSISLVTVPKSDGVWEDVKKGYYRGFSHAGSFAKRYCQKCETPVSKGAWCPVCKEDRLMKYVPVLAEVSYVDSPCLKNATFTAVKADGKEEQVPFKKTDDAYSAATLATESKLAEILARLDQIAPPITAPPIADKAASADVKKGVLHLVTDADGAQHLPYTGPDGNPDHRLMGAAWAALHGGYRGNKYEGHDKDKAISQLVALYAKQGMETPAAKFTRVVTEAVQKTSKGKLAKGMFEVAEVAGIIQQIAWVQQTAVWEREWEKDESTLPEEFQALLDHAVTVFLHQVAEETSELTEAARAATAASDAAEAAEKTSKGVNNMAEKTNFVKVFSAVLGVEKAHGLAHHIGKMAKCVKAFHAEGAGLHKSHHEAMTGHLDAMKDMEDAAKAAKAKGHLAKAKECADGHMADGMEMHADHANEMAGHFGKMGKILGVEEADKWADEASDVPEGVGGEPSGATGNDYDKSRKAAKAAAASDDKETFTKAEMAEMISTSLGEFMKNLTEGIAAGAEVEEPPVAKRAPGIGDRSQVRFPQSGQGRGAVNKGQDTSGQTQEKAPGATDVTTEAPTPEDIQKAMYGQGEEKLAALKKLGFGVGEQPMPTDVSYSMSMMGR